MAQRMFCAKDERHSLLATLWFNIAHYAVRPWPWILVGLASIILYPDLADKETGYVRVMIDHLPPYLRGLIMQRLPLLTCQRLQRSSIGAPAISSMIFTGVFFRQTADEKHYVHASQLATVLITIVSAVVTFYMDSIAGAEIADSDRREPDADVLVADQRLSEVSAMTSAFVIS